MRERTGPFVSNSLYSGYDYDPRSNALSVLLRNGGLLCKFYLRSYAVWLTVVTFIVVALLNKFETFGVHFPKFELASLAIPTTLVSFFATFYNQNSFSKYWNSYTLSQHMKGTLHDVIIAATTYFRGVEDVRLMEVTRLINLLHHRFYGFMQENGDDSIEAHEFRLAECATIEVPCNVPKGCSPTLITSGEMATLASMPTGLQYMVIIQWVFKECNKASRESGPKGAVDLTSFHLQMLESKILGVREDMGKVVTQVAKPMPLQYYWAILFFSTIVFVGYAYGAALNDISISWLPLMVYTLGIVGMLEISRNLAMPFGRDDVDLPCKRYWWAAYQSTYGIALGRSVHIQHTAGKQLVAKVDDEAQPLLYHNTTGDHKGCSPFACHKK